MWLVDVPALVLPAPLPLEVVLVLLTPPQPLLLALILTLLLFPLRPDLAQGAPPPRREPWR